MRKGASESQMRHFGAGYLPKLVWERLLTAD
jgi:hypothetical protein